MPPGKQKQKDELWVKHQPRMPQNSVDLRSRFEKERDGFVLEHYTRVAELDVIEEIAHKQNDMGLLEAVESIRRKENMRFWHVMQKLKIRQQVTAEEPLQ